MFWTRLLLQSTDMLISSVESQKGVNSVQWCSVENQKGTVQSLDGDGALLIFNITSLNNALLLLRQFVHAARCVNGVYSAMPSQYCQKVTVRGNFCGGFIFTNFASQSSQKFPPQYMAIYSNEIIAKISKLSHCEFPHLVQNRKNICTRNIWRIQYHICCFFFFFSQFPTRYQKSQSSLRPLVESLRRDWLRSTSRRMAMTLSMENRCRKTSSLRSKVRTKKQSFVLM